MPISGEQAADDGPIVEFMIRFVRLDELRRLHVDDGSGHCATCSEGGQAGRSVWPCRIAHYVERASARGT